MIGFMPDGHPRRGEAVRRPSGLWVAGDQWLERHDTTGDARPAGDVYATTERAWQEGTEAGPAPLPSGRRVRRLRH